MAMAWFFAMMAEGEGFIRANRVFKATMPLS